MLHQLRRAWMAVVAACLCVSFAAAAKAAPSKAEQGFDQNGKVVDLKKWFATLPVRLNKEKAKGFTGLYDLSVSGSKGGHWWVSVKNQKAAVVTKPPKDKATCVVQVADENWFKIINGEMSAGLAVFTGKLHIKGVEGHANKFGDIFFP